MSRFLCLQLCLVWSYHCDEPIWTETEPVRRVEWSEGLVAELTRLGAPALFRAPPSLHPDTADGWSLDQLLERFRVGTDGALEMEDVKRMPGVPGGRMFRTSQPMRDQPGILPGYKPHFSQHNLTADEFFSRWQETTDGAWSYTPRLSEWPLAAGSNDLLVSDTGNRDDAGSWKLEYVWIGQSGTVTPLHHDHYQNFFHQLWGKKEFLLIPPSSHRDLCLYPSLHPAHRSSQLWDRHLWDRHRGPDHVDAEGVRYGVLPALEAVLGPGDVLYIPPLWFHHVTTITHSLGINVWSDWAPTQWYNELLGALSPALADGDDRDVQVQTLRTFLLLLLDDLDVTTVWVRDHLIESRYRHVVTLRGTDADVCQEGDSARGDRGEECSDESVNYCHHDEAFGRVAGDGYLLHVLGAAVAHRGTLLRRIRTEGGQDAFEIFLLNFLEHAAEGSLGARQVKAFFLDLCAC